MSPLMWFLVLTELQSLETQVDAVGTEQQRFVASRVSEFSDDELQSGSDEAEHNVWSRELGLCFPVYLGQRFQDHLTDVERERLALSRHIACDILCGDPSQAHQLGLVALFSWRCGAERGRHTESVPTSKCA